MAKPPGPVIGPAAIKAIEKACDAVFDRAKNRVLGPWSAPKQLAIGYNREWSLPGIFAAAAKEEGYIPDLKTLNQLLRIAGDYIDATRHATKAKVVKEVTSFLQEAYSSGVKTDLPTVLGGKLQEVFGDAVVSMRRIIESETNQVKNVGILEGISRVNASLGVEDPIVYFVSVNDASRCSECERLHTIDGVTPRLWRLSQVGHGYHKKGDANPKLCGLHPNCFMDSRTPVLTEAGWKRIVNVAVGEKVLTHLGHFKKVLAQVKYRYSEKPVVSLEYLYLGNVQKLNVTPDHKFLTNRGWVQAGDITVADKLVKLRVPCSVCRIKEVKQEVVGRGKFRLNETCGDEDCLSKLRSVNVGEWHANMTLEEKAIRASNCSSGTSEYILRSGTIPCFSKPEYWTAARRLAASESIISRMPAMLRAGASTRVSKNQLLAFGWLKSAFPDEKIELEYSVLTYAIDIAFPSSKLAIEIDGKYHEGDRLITDAKRDAKLSEQGWTVLRFGVNRQESVNKASIVSGAARILSNHNELYSFEEIEIKSVSSKESAWNANVYCLTVEDDESFVARGVVSHNCRCTLATLTPGWGFVGGRVAYISRDHDEWAKQNSLGKSEDLEKSFATHDFVRQLAALGWTPSKTTKEHYFEHPTVTQGAFSLEGRTRQLALGHSQQHTVPDYKAKAVLGDAGLHIIGGQMAPNPKHPYYKLYQASGHAPPDSNQSKTWVPDRSQSDIQSIPMDKLVSTADPIHFKVGQHHRKFQLGQPNPHIEALPGENGTYLINEGEEVFAAAKQHGMTHAPVKVLG